MLETTRAVTTRALIATLAVVMAASCGPPDEDLIELDPAFDEPTRRPMSRDVELESAHSEEEISATDLMREFEASLLPERLEPVGSLPTQSELTSTETAEAEQRSWRYAGRSNRQLAKLRGRVRWRLLVGMKGGKRLTKAQRRRYKAADRRILAEQKLRRAAGRWPDKPFADKRYRKLDDRELRRSQRKADRMVRWGNRTKHRYFSPKQKRHLVLAVRLSRRLHAEALARGAFIVLPVIRLWASTRRKMRKHNNRILGRMLAAKRGWTGAQWRCLERLWTRESSWNERARNPTSGACGIPQALPCSKMRSAGKDYATNPKTQIRWGLGYIRGRYSTPCRAWSHSQTYRWY